MISIGRERADPAAPLTQDYLSRISKFHPIDGIVIKPGPKETVKTRVLKETSRSSLVVAMDQRGTMLSSNAFASLVDSWMNMGHVEVAFVIGPAEGLPKEVTDRADLLLSMSPMTFPHRLARLFLAEQLYRALCAIRNIPYNK